MPDDTSDKPQPEKRFTLTFSMEGEEFQQRLAASAIMHILGKVSGSIATGRWSGIVHGKSGQEIGNFTVVWRAGDPKPGPIYPVTPKSG